MAWSPGTSDSSRLTTRAGLHATARRPPLMADRCLRTQFISPMLAPLASSARLMACLSARLRPGNASGSRAEPPPEMRHSTRSSAVSPCTSASMRRAAASPAASGTGWAASTISMCWQGTACPYRVTTSPDKGPCQWSSTARAIAADALPAPTTTSRPLGGLGRCRGTHRAGWAAAMAASSMSRSNWRGGVDMGGEGLGKDAGVGEPAPMRRVQQKRGGAWPWARPGGLRRPGAAGWMPAGHTRPGSPGRWWPCRPGRRCAAPGWP